MTGSEMTGSEMTGSANKRSGNPTTDPLVSILANEEEIQPMTGFSTRVLRRVREDTAAPEPMVFPWTRFLTGFVLNLGLLFGVGLWRVLESEGSSQAPFPTEWLADPQFQGVLWALLAMVGTGLLAWTASRWAAPSRVGTF